MTTASRPLATALWGARFAAVWLPSCSTKWGDTTLTRTLANRGYRSHTMPEHCKFRIYLSDHKRRANEAIKRALKR